MIFKKKVNFLLNALTVSTLFLSNVMADEIDDEIDAATECVDTESERPTKAVEKNRSNITVLSSLLAFGIPEFIGNNDIYLKTNTVLKRPVNTLPIFNLYHTDYTHQDWLINILLFGSKTDRAFYTDCSPFIKSFLFLNNPALLDLLNNFDFGFDSKKLINIAKHAKKEERRAGLMIQFFKNFDDFSFELDIPLFYEERNYFFKPDEKEELENFFGERPEKQEEKEFRKHAISDKIGIGDARIKIGYPIIKKENICTQFGVQLTLPIAFALKKGLLGSDFMEKTDQRPTFSFKRAIELFDASQDSSDKQAKAKFREFGREFAFEAADWLSAMVLDSSMGNGGHFGLGAFLEPQIKINEGVTLKALSYIEYFFSAKEKRFFLQKKNPALFTDEVMKEALESEEAATKEVNFLNKQFVNTVFPNKFDADITPGFMCQVTFGPRFRIREWDLFFGYDFWYQHEEKINHIHSNLNNLKINKALNRNAFSHKLLGKLTYNRIKTTHDWCFSLSVEDAIYTKAIGKDYSVSAGFEINY